MFVDVGIGEEYITELTFDPTTLTLIPILPDLIFMDGYETNQSSSDPAR